MGSLWYWRVLLLLLFLILNFLFLGNLRFEIELKFKFERFEIWDIEIWVYVFLLNKLVWFRYEIFNGVELYWSGFYKLCLVLFFVIFVLKLVFI